MYANFDIDLRGAATMPTDSPYETYLPSFREQLRASGVTAAARLLGGVTCPTALSVPLVLMLGDHLIFMDVYEGDSLATRAALCDRLTAAARVYSLFHKPSDGRALSCAMLLPNAGKRAKVEYHFDCALIPLHRLGEYLQKLAPADLPVDSAAWLAQDPRDGADMLRDRIDNALAKFSRFLLDGWVDDAKEQAEQLHKMGYRIYQTENYGAAKEYCRVRYEDDPAALYGMVTSAEAENLFAYGGPKGGGGIKRRFEDDAEDWADRWFDPAHPNACRHFNRAACEHEVKGKRLDFEILGWGDDMIWAGRWKPKKVGMFSLSLDIGRSIAINGKHRPRPPKAGGQLVEEGPNYRLGAYHVLLNAPKDGMILFTQTDAYVDGPKRAMLAAGAKTAF